MTGLYGAPYGINVQAPATPGGSNTTDESLRAAREALTRANERTKDYYDQLQAAKEEVEALKTQIAALPAPQDGEGEEEASSGVPTWAIVGGAIVATAVATYFLTRKVRGTP